MRVIRCDSSHQEQWNAFVHACPRASFYHRWEWRDINQRCFGHQTEYLAAVDGDRFVGVFPLVRLKTLLFGTIGCSMPFVNYGGPCGDSDDIERALLAEAARVADQWGVAYLEIRSKRRLGGEYPCSEHKVSMTVALDGDTEGLWNALKVGTRKEVRRASNKGFTVRQGPQLLDDFYAVLSESWRELGTPIYAPDYLRTVLSSFADSTRLTMVYAADGRPAAGALDGLHGGIVEGMWLGMRPEFRQQLVGYVLYWELIKDASDRGFQLYHLGRSSKDSGGEQFKKKWNADSVPLYWQYILRTRRDVPSLNPADPRYGLAIKAWQKLPLGITQFLGPFIARGIP